MIRNIATYYPHANKTGESYYIQGQRISSKIGGGFADVEPLGFRLDQLENNQGTTPYANYDEFSEALAEMRGRSFDCVNLDPGKVETDGPLDIIHELAEEDLEENQIYFYHPDHLGSSSFITDVNGDAHQHMQYLPYGEDFISQRIDWQTRYTFSAKEKDEATGYHYFGARYYDSDVSQFISVDPAGRRYPSESDYSYAGNNPVMFIDFNGLFKLPKEFRNKYPKASQFLDFYVYNYVKNMGSSGWVHLMKYGEFKDRKDLLNSLKMGQGSFIVAKESLVDDVWPQVRWAAGRYITKDEKQRRENKKKEPEIWINEDILDYYENAETRKEKLIAGLMLVSTVLHENTHYGDMKDGVEGSSCLGYSDCHTGEEVEKKLYHGKSIAGGKGLEAMRADALRVLEYLNTGARQTGISIYGNRIPKDSPSKMPTKGPDLIDN